MSELNTCLVFNFEKENMSFEVEVETEDHEVSEELNVDIIVALSSWIERNVDDFEPLSMTRMKDMIRYVLSSFDEIKAFAFRKQWRTYNI